jgi:hypothetical protein
MASNSVMLSQLTKTSSISANDVFVVSKFVNTKYETKGIFVNNVANSISKMLPLHFDNTNIISGNLSLTSNNTTNVVVSEFANCETAEIIFKAKEGLNLSFGRMFITDGVIFNTFYSQSGANKINFVADMNAGNIRLNFNREFASTANVNLEYKAYTK